MIKRITLMIGLNDQDSKQQEISTLDAYKIVANTLGVDCTITEGRGVYTHEDGTITFETSLVVSILDFTNELKAEWLDTKLDELKRVLNQESIAVQYDKIASELK